MKSYFCSTIGRKQLVAVTGLMLSGFVLSHMSGNLLLLFDPVAYNKYGHSIVSMPFFHLIEFSLLAIFLIHMGMAAALTRANRLAKPIAPHCGGCSSKAARFGSRSMILTGGMVGVFTIWHLLTFRFGPYYTVFYDGVEMRDLYRLVVEVFQSPLHTVWYVFAMLLLFVHLAHGAGAVLQTLGIASVRNGAVKKVGYAIAALVAFGFLIQPVYIFLCGGTSA